MSLLYQSSIWLFLPILLMSNSRKKLSFLTRFLIFFQRQQYWQSSSYFKTQKSKFVFKPISLLQNKQQIFVRKLTKFQFFHQKCCLCKQEIIKVSQIEFFLEFDVGGIGTYGQFHETFTTVNRHVHKSILLPQSYFYGTNSSYIYTYGHQLT